jgi:hypothetical protein
MNGTPTSRRAQGERPRGTSNPGRAWPLLAALMAALLASATVSPVAGATPAGTDKPSAATSPQRMGFASGDDWEPAIAADRFGHTYVLYKHYDVDGGGTCRGCDIHLLVQRSDDGGRTWSVPRPIAPGKAGGGQYDSQIVVDPVDGRTVWAAFLQGDVSRIAVVSSTDFGQTWSKPRIVSGPTRGFDKPTLVVRGSTIAVAYDDDLDSWASVSTDGGATWAIRRVFAATDAINLPLSAGGGIDSHGNLFFTWDSWDVAHVDDGNGPVTLWVSRSTDGGATWTRTIIDVSGAPYPCIDCGFAFLSAQLTMTVGPDDTVYLLWNSTPGSVDGGPERIYFARSTDHGRTFSAAREVSSAAAEVEHSFPAVTAGAAPGDVRISWMDMRAGRWNVFYRRSSDGGRRFGPEVQVSQLARGYPYIHRDGFDLPYGDYMQLAVNDAGLTQAAWGEGPSYAGPGNIWVATIPGG